MRFRFSIKALLILIALCAIGLAIPYWIPKSRPLRISETYVGYYHGLGLHPWGGYFGTNWYRVVVHDEPDLTWEVDVRRTGYRSYRGHYNTGVLREEGTCFVEAIHGEMIPDRHKVQDATYFDPSGKLISEVRSGTGKQILCSGKGTRVWELDLANGVRQRLIMRYPNGQLLLETDYVGGHVHGLRVSYHSNGQIRSRGEYRNGKQVGVWTHYGENGSFETETDYGNAKE